MSHWWVPLHDRAQELEPEARRAFSSGVPLEDIIQWGRDQDCNVIDCIKLVRALTGCSLRSAKMLVHCSRAWSDKRAEHEELHEQAFRALEEWVAELEVGELPDR